MATNTLPPTTANNTARCPESVPLSCLSLPTHIITRYCSICKGTVIFHFPNDAQWSAYLSPAPLHRNCPYIWPYGKHTLIHVCPLCRDKSHAEFGGPQAVCDCNCHEIYKRDEELRSRWYRKCLICWACGDSGEVHKMVEKCWKCGMKNEGTGMEVWAADDGQWVDVEEIQKVIKEKWRKSFNWGMSDCLKTR